MMQIVLHTYFIDSNGSRYRGTNSFSNEKNYLPNDVENILKKFNCWDKIVPGFYYMQSLGNNPNVFSPPNGESYFVGIDEVSLNYVLPPDCYETGVDINKILTLIKGEVLPVELAEEMLYQAFVELNERKNWINQAPDFFKMPELTKLIEKHITNG